MDKKSRPREIGSEFHWCGLGAAPRLPWPAGARWLTNGRVALPCLLNGVAGRVVWIPSYFCDEVVDSWTAAGAVIRTYVDRPDIDATDLNTVNASAGDTVIAVNFFGMREGRRWDEWKQLHPDVVLVEDHTHDPFSEWAVVSNADFAFASVRKISPIADGAILWSPIGLEVPVPPPGTGWTGSAFKLAAMVLKAEYLGEGATNAKLKEDFRSLQIDGERLLGGSPTTEISPWSWAAVKRGYPREWRTRRAENVIRFAGMFQDSADARLITRQWPVRSCPFNPVLVFATEALRNRVRRFLIDHGVYGAVHWEQSSTSDPAAISLGGRILTIPLDQRYDAEDVTHVCALLDECRALIAEEMTHSS